MQSILQHLFKKNSLQDVPVKSLQQMTKDFPYFAIGQYLLAKKLGESGDPAYNSQLQKTSIYFNNPLWLQYLVAENPAGQSAGHGPEIYSSDDQSETSDFTTNAVESTHDMIEDMVLHQENDYHEETDLRQTPQEISAEAPAVNIAGTKEPEIQEPIPFQAYYTVDYFASQGIKLAQDSQQNDKLGKQLKSFTEWLKTMRRLPETSVVEILDKISDGEIAKIAAHSLDEKEVVTEAMAEVLVKQGKTDKARELYNKLSLQNPQKSTYFATKIEVLKQH